MSGLSSSIIKHTRAAALRRMTRHMALQISRRYLAADKLHATRAFPSSAPLPSRRRLRPASLVPTCQRGRFSPAAKAMKRLTTVFCAGDTVGGRAGTEGAVDCEKKVWIGSSTSSSRPLPPSFSSSSSRRLRRAFFGGPHSSEPCESGVLPDPDASTSGAAAVTEFRRCGATFSVPADTTTFLPCPL